MKPLAVDLYCGLGGWSEGLLFAGWRVVGFDIIRRPYPAQLVLQDVLTLHGSQFRDADLIVASPPCQGYSYRAMPWSRAKALPPPDNSMFDACFRIQREACEASGRYIPLIVENVKGAQKWVGPARWHYGSYYLWGDVPALMPITTGGVKVPGLNWNGSDKPGYVAKAFNTTAQQRMAHDDGRKVSHHSNADIPEGTGKTTWFFRNTKHENRGAGVKQGGGWWHDPASMTRRFSSRSSARKAASAAIAKIPFPLALYIAQCFKPLERAA